MSKEQEAFPAELLAKVTAMPQGAPATTEVNPFERNPRLRVGDDPTKATFLPGMTINGYFVENITVATPKSDYGDSKTVHILRAGTPTGDKFEIWSVAELEAFFENMLPGTFVTIHYKSRGLNAKGNKQHFFELKRSGVQ